MGLKVYIIAGSLDLSNSCYPSLGNWLSCIVVFPICVKLLFPNLSFKKKFSLFFQLRHVLQVKFYRYHLNIYHQMQKFTNILFQQIYIIILLQSRLRIGKINTSIITNVADLAFLNCTFYTILALHLLNSQIPQWQKKPTKLTTTDYSDYN